MYYVTERLYINIVYMDDDYTWKYRAFEYPNIYYVVNYGCVMKFEDDALVITCNSTQAVRIKINSLRTPKNYLVPVTKKVIPNRYRPYTITATSNLDVS